MTGRRKQRESIVGKIFKRSATAVAAIVVAAALTAVAVFMGVGRGPRVDGELALPALTDKVRVLRDERGMPSIFASNTPDLIRAQGFVTAQDRIFQMEGYRAIATGRLAEAIGEAGLAYETSVDDMGDKLTRSYLDQWYIWQERFDELVRTPDSPWFDDARTPQTETLPDLVRRAAITVRSDLAARHGRRGLALGRRAPHPLLQPAAAHRRRA